MCKIMEGGIKKTVIPCFFKFVTALFKLQLEPCTGVMQLQSLDSQVFGCIVKNDGLPGLDWLTGSISIIRHTIQSVNLRQQHP